jgi:D-alanine transaminase
MSRLTELALINDRLVSLTDARVAIDDGGVYFGDGIYEVLRLCNQHLFARQEHMERFACSLAEMGMRERVDLDWINKRIDQALAATTLTDALLYFQVTRNRPQRSLTIPDDWEPRFLLTLRQSQPRQSETIRVISHPDQRWKRCDIKSLNLLANVMAKQAAQMAGVDDALLVDDYGLVTESTSSSVMMIEDRTLWTAPLTANILASVTRKRILDRAAGIGLAVREQSFTVEQALKADELFVVGTTSEVLAIIELDGQGIADGKKRDRSIKLHDGLRQDMFH